MAIVFHAERAEGLAQPLLDFVHAWKLDGPFPLTIPPEGALRWGPFWEQWQADAFDKGTTKARTLAETPHGRGAALDCYPALVVGARCAGILSQWDGGRGRDAHLFFQYGLRAKAAGLEWGGSWPGSWDAPHIQLVDWQSIPFPKE